jgi:hypothetical protein
MSDGLVLFLWFFEELSEIFGFGVLVTVCESVVEERNKWDDGS